MSNRNTHRHARGLLPLPAAPEVLARRWFPHFAESPVWDEALDQWQERLADPEWAERIAREELQACLVDTARKRGVLRVPRRRGRPKKERLHVDTVRAEVRRYAAVLREARRCFREDPDMLRRVADWILPEQEISPADRRGFIRAIAHSKLTPTQLSARIIRAMNTTPPHLSMRDLLRSRAASEPDSRNHFLGSGSV